jgi:pyruvate dehydrogenase E2 component (dihydrolipoamide acetyltransferase)
MSSTSIVMPKLGLTMEEGLLAEWKVRPGDSVKTGDVIFVVETDKIANDIEAAEEGVIESLRINAGEVVRVGSVVATLTVHGVAQTDGSPTGDPLPEQSPSASPSPAASSDSSSAQSIRSAASGRIRPIATPQARRRARSSGLDLGVIRGSGPRGRIVVQDVAAALAQRDVQAQSPAPAASPSTAAVRPRAELRPLGEHQRVIARRLSEAKREIPHFYINTEVDVTSLLQVRASLNADPACAKVSVNHFILTAVARALAAIPEVNVLWSDDGLLQFRDVDIGVAIETQKGLIAPVLPNIGACSLDEIAQAATLLVERARVSRLTREDLHGGATCISNVGMFGATMLIPIINPGQSSIFGIGCIQDVFRPDADRQPQLRQVLNVSLSCDHRVIDGALAARLLQQVQTALAQPMSLLRRPLREGAAKCISSCPKTSDAA